MKKSEAKQYKELLLILRARLRGDVNNLADAALRKTRSEASGDLSSMPIHMADVGSDNFEQEFTLTANRVPTDSAPRPHPWAQGAWCAVSGARSASPAWTFRHSRAAGWAGALQHDRPARPHGTRRPDRTPARPQGPQGPALHQQAAPNPQRSIYRSASLKSKFDRSLTSV